MSVSPRCVQHAWMHSHRGLRAWVVQAHMVHRCVITRMCRCLGCVQAYAFVQVEAGWLLHVLSAWGCLLLRHVLLSASVRVFNLGLHFSWKTP